MQKVSVIIVNYNGEKHLDDCLSSIVRQDYSNIEIIIVDNNSSDRSEEIARKYNGERFIKLEKNVGLAEGCNIGARESNGDYFCFVNNDMRFEPDFIRKMVDILQSSPEIFAVDALHYNWQGDKILHAGTLLRKTLFLKGHIPGFIADPIAFIDEIAEVPWGCLANLMVKRNMFFELGGFDHTFFTYYEDTDLCWRAWLRGWKTIYTPFAKAYHKVGMTSDEFLFLKSSIKINPLRAISCHKNHIRFILKTMDLPIIFKMLLAIPIKIIVYFIKGNFKSLQAFLTALFRITFFELKDILKERKKIKSSAVKTNDFLIAKFSSQKIPSINHSRF